MHGVLILSTRSGACLFARAFTENFGLPGEWSTGDGDEAVSPTGRSFGAMQLAGLLFALRAYAADLEPLGHANATCTATNGNTKPHLTGGAPLDESETNPKNHPRGRFDRNKKSETQRLRKQALRRYSLRDVTISFEESEVCGVLVAVFAHTNLGALIPKNIAKQILTGFVAKHGVWFGGAGCSSLKKNDETSPSFSSNRRFAGFGPARTLLFHEEVLNALMSVPAELARVIAGEADLGSTWIYVGMRDNESTWGVRGVDDGDTDQAVSRVAKKNNCFRWFSCCGTDATRRGAKYQSGDKHGDKHGDTRYATGDTHSSRGLQFVASCAPRRATGPGVEPSHAWRLPLSQTTLARLVELMDAVVGTARTAGTGTGGDTSASVVSVEYCVSGLHQEAYYSENFENAEKPNRRVLLFNHGNCVVALPDERGGVGSSAAGNETASETAVKTAVINARIVAKLVALHELMRFIEQEKGSGPGVKFPGAQGNA